MAQRPMPEREGYPNNSDRSRTSYATERPKSPKKIDPKPTKVTHGKVVQKKKSFGRKFAEAFGAREGQGVIDYILYDIVIPATKNMIVDSIINGAEMAILGEVRDRRRSNGYSSSTSRYRYDRVSYRDDCDRRDRRDNYEDRHIPRGLHDYEDILFDNQQDAEDVIQSMLNMLDTYGQVTVQDLYGLVGITPEYTVGNYGWRNLRDVHSRRIRDGWVIELPRAVAL